MAAHEPFRVDVPFDQYTEKLSLFVDGNLYQTKLVTVPGQAGVMEFVFPSGMPDDLAHIYQAVASNASGQSGPSAAGIYGAVPGMPGQLVFVKL